MIAQLSAISSTISAAAVLWRNRVDRMGRSSMGVLRESGVPRSPGEGEEGYCDFNCIAGVTCMACQAGTIPASRLATMASAKVASSIHGSRCASSA